MDDDTSMMSIERGEYCGVSGVGSRIWDLLEKPASLSQIKLTIRAEFEVGEETCQADGQRFIQELMNNGMALAV